MTNTGNNVGGAGKGKGDIPRTNPKQNPSRKEKTSEAFRSLNPDKLKELNEKAKSHQQKNQLSEQVVSKITQLTLTDIDKLKPEQSIQISQALTHDGSSGAPLIQAKMDPAAYDALIDKIASFEYERKDIEVSDDVSQSNYLGDSTVTSEFTPKILLHHSPFLNNPLVDDELIPLIKGANDPETQDQTNRLKLKLLVLASGQKWLGSDGSNSNTLVFTDKEQETLKKMAPGNLSEQLQQLILAILQRQGAKASQKNLSGSEARTMNKNIPISDSELRSLVKVIDERYEQQQEIAMELVEIRDQYKKSIPQESQEDFTKLLINTQKTWIEKGSYDSQDKKELLASIKELIPKKSISETLLTRRNINTGIALGGSAAAVGATWYATDSYFDSVHKARLEKLASSELPYTLNKDSFAYPNFLRNSEAFEEKFSNVANAFYAEFLETEPQYAAKLKLTSLGLNPEDDLSTVDTLDAVNTPKKSFVVDKFINTSIDDKTDYNKEEVNQLLETTFTNPDELAQAQELFRLLGIDGVRQALRDNGQKDTLINKQISKLIKTDMVNKKKVFDTLLSSDLTPIKAREAVEKINTELKGQYNSKGVFQSIFAVNTLDKNSGEAKPIYLVDPDLFNDNFSIDFNSDKLSSNRTLSRRLADLMISNEAKSIASKEEPLGSAKAATEKLAAKAPAELKELVLQAIEGLTSELNQSQYLSVASMAGSLSYGSDYSNPAIFTQKIDRENLSDEQNKFIESIITNIQEQAERRKEQNKIVNA